MSDIDFAGLAAPIPLHAVKTLEKEYTRDGQKKSFTVSFITARTVMNRLDGVLGPGNWYDRYETLPEGTVKCTLFIRVGDEWVGKQDVGTESNIEEDKGAHSDAFKRAAVKWGIGRELHGDGTVYAHLLAQQNRNGNATPPENGQEPDTSPQDAKTAPKTRGNDNAGVTTPVGAEMAHVATDSELDDFLRGDPEAGQEDLTWVKDRPTINKFVKWAREEVWDHPTLPHTRNRILAALEVENTGDFGIDLSRYVGTKRTAMKAIRAYVPSGEQDQSKLVEMPETHTSESDAA